MTNDFADMLRDAALQIENERAKVDGLILACRCASSVVESDATMVRMPLNFWLEISKALRRFEE